MSPIGPSAAPRLRGSVGSALGIAATALMLMCAAVEKKCQPQGTPGHPFQVRPRPACLSAGNQLPPIRVPYEIATRGAVVEDVRIINANLVINADNVTVRRVEIQGGHIFNNASGRCHNGLLLEDVSLVRGPGQITSDADPPAITTGGYLARRVKIDGLPERLPCWRTEPRLHSR